MKKSIVIIDDSIKILEFLSNYLSDTYTVHTYLKGSEAIKDIQTYQVNPDLILTDFHMPNDYSGMRVMEELVEQGNSFPFIILSGSCDINEKIGCIENGAYDFVEKPFNPKELEARIGRVLKTTAFKTQLSYAI
jgi:DNA-binding response OmpR family regulator